MHRICSDLEGGPQLAETRFEFVAKANAVLAEPVQTRASKDEGRPSTGILDLCVTSPYSTINKLISSVHPTAHRATDCLFLNSFSDQFNTEHASFNAAILLSVFVIAGCSSPIARTRASKHSTQCACIITSRERTYLVARDISRQSELILEKSVLDAVSPQKTRTASFLAKH